MNIKWWSRKAQEKLDAGVPAWKVILFEINSLVVIPAVVILSLTPIILFFLFTYPADKNTAFIGYLLIIGTPVLYFRITRTIL